MKYFLIAEKLVGLINVDKLEQIRFEDWNNEGYCSFGEKADNSISWEDNLVVEGVEVEYWTNDAKLNFLIIGNKSSDPNKDIIEVYKF